jgi:hypothetical protein
MLRFPLIYANLPLMSLVSRYKKSKLAWWTLVMTWVLLLLFAWNADGFMVLFHISKSFLTGDLEAMRKIDTPMVPVAIAIAVVLVPIKIALLPVLEKQTAQQTDVLHISSPQRLYMVIMISMFLEELLARLFFLELMTRLLAGTVFFYLLSIGGNTFWALLHWLNLTNKQDSKLIHKLVMVLPRFISGIFYTMIFVSHGFFAALCTHTIHNMVLLSANCRIYFTYSRFLLSFYHLIFLGVYSLLFFGVRNHSFSDIKLAARNEVKNWVFIDYFSLIGLLTTATFLAMELLWYDLERTQTRKEYLLNLVYISLLMALAYFAISQVDILFTGDVLTVTVGLAVCITFLEKVRSGSGISRLFWKSLLITIVLVVIQAEDRSLALFLLLPFLLHQLGERAIRVSSYFRDFSTFIDLGSFAVSSAVRGGMPLRTAIQMNAVGMAKGMILVKLKKKKMKLANKV